MSHPQLDTGLLRRRLAADLAKADHAVTVARAKIPGLSFMDDETRLLIEAYAQAQVTAALARHELRVAKQEAA